jgi:hypothetical protein
MQSQISFTFISVYLTFTNKHNLMFCLTKWGSVKTNVTILKIKVNHKILLQFDEAFYCKGRKKYCSMCIAKKILVLNPF